ncbi:hypothetical protein ERICIV_02417 [Paenibacillus larvae subsp. larvae]|uniref:Uncharacterized protein n=1 Tax=Paenibacillus larvae subsp. larvae TaxID=147375 RepID=A0A2L1UEF7_9BACL|nr:hypothetical protein B5S25_20055 [Paenibacillus larvae subsp. pulvifaciens]AVF26595.1 hypothetical protein ERICIII_02443 [Paenibacillus larvae subsp. larvae]AVF31327.1 hypothetical protein ERICIV_02417 [Paenibacillus larvae subsp. larvae]MBH0342200.1 hypothetical protein [Paenibacillus larvae]
MLIPSKNFLFNFQQQNTTYEQWQKLIGIYLNIFTDCIYIFSNICYFFRWNILLYDFIYYLLEGGEKI